MESSTVGMAVPPPPPPPPPMLSTTGTENGRSQLLADIRKGATLKKAPILNDSNHNVRIMMKKGNSGKKFHFSI